MPGEIFPKDIVPGKPYTKDMYNGLNAELLKEIFKDQAADVDLQDIGMNSTCIKTHKANASTKR